MNTLSTLVPVCSWCSWTYVHHHRFGSCSWTEHAELSWTGREHLQVQQSCHFTIFHDIFFFLSSFDTYVLQQSRERSAFALSMRQIAKKYQKWQKKSPKNIFPKIFWGKCSKFEFVNMFTVSSTVHEHVHERSCAMNCSCAGVAQGDNGSWTPGLVCSRLWTEHRFREHPRLLISPILIIYI